MNLLLILCMTPLQLFLVVVDFKDSNDDDDDDGDDDDTSSSDITYVVVVTQAKLRI